MLLAIGVGSAAGMTEGVITVICDQFPGYKRWAVTLIVCVIGFFIGLVYVTPGGQYLVTLGNQKRLTLSPLVYVK